MKKIVACVLIILAILCSSSCIVSSPSESIEPMESEPPERDAEELVNALRDRPLQSNEIYILPTCAVMRGNDLYTLGGSQGTAYADTIIRENLISNQVEIVFYDEYNINSLMPFLDNSLLLFESSGEFYWYSILNLETLEITSMFEWLEIPIQGEIDYLVPLTNGDIFIFLSQEQYGEQTLFFYNHSDKTLNRVGDKIVGYIIGDELLVIKKHGEVCKLSDDNSGLEMIYKLKENYYYPYVYCYEYTLLFIEEGKLYEYVYEMGDEGNSGELKYLMSGFDGLNATITVVNSFVSFFDPDSNTWIVFYGGKEILRMNDEGKKCNFRYACIIDNYFYYLNSELGTVKVEIEA